jgi:hypothetical protein
MALKDIATKPLPAGFRWVKCRFRKARAKAGTPDSERKILDAHAYGYKCWSFPVRTKHLILNPLRRVFLCLMPNTL